MEKVEVISPIYIFEKARVIALEDKVIVEYASPIKDFQVEYRFSELKPRVVRGRSGDPGWSHVGLYLLIAALLLANLSFFVFHGFYKSPYFPIVVLSLALLALIACSLRLLKYDKVWFDEKDGSSGFMIKLTKNNREEAEKVISFITEKINAEKTDTALRVE